MTSNRGSRGMIIDAGDVGREREAQRRQVPQRRARPSATCSRAM